MRWCEEEAGYPYDKEKDVTEVDNEQTQTVLESQTFKLGLTDEDAVIWTFKENDFSLLYM